MLVIRVRRKGARWRVNGRLSPPTCAHYVEQNEMNDFAGWRHRGCWWRLLSDEYGCVLEIMLEDNGSLWKDCLSAMQAIMNGWCFRTNSTWMISKRIDICIFNAAEGKLISDQYLNKSIAFVCNRYRLWTLSNKGMIWRYKQDPVEEGWVSTKLLNWIFIK